MRLCVCVCVSKHVWVIHHRKLLLSLLSECLCLPVALIWSGHTGGQSHSTLREDFCSVHPKDKSLRLGSHLPLASHPDTDKAGKQKFVTHITTKYTDMGRNKPCYEMSDYSGKGSGLVVMDVVSSVLGLSFSFVRTQIPVSPWNCYWLSRQSGGSLSSINATWKYSFPAVCELLCFHASEVARIVKIDLLFSFALHTVQLKFCLLGTGLLY